MYFDDYQNMSRDLIRRGHVAILMSARRVCEVYLAIARVPSLALRAAIDGG